MTEFKAAVDLAREVAGRPGEYFAATVFFSNTLIWAAEELKRLREEINDMHVTDAAKTREINVLVQEDHKLRAELQREQAAAKVLEDMLKSIQQTLQIRQEMDEGKDMAIPQIQIAIEAARKVRKGND